MDPLFSFLLGHLIGDYALQSDKMAQHKNHNNLLLLLHCLVYTAAIVAMSLIHDIFYDPDITLKVLPWIVPIFAIHFAQDFLKSRYFNGSRQFYYIDQCLHLVTLYVLRILIGG